jgi:hypothetical protein
MNTLTDYPVSCAPETWKLNSLSLDAIRRNRQVWKTHGYSWLFGQEHEFTPRTIEDFEKTELMDNKLRPEELLTCSPFTAPSLDLYNRLKAGAEDGADKALRRMIGYIARAHAVPAFAKQTGLTPRDMTEQLRSFQKDIVSSDADKADLARRNAYLAFLHLMPAAEGGIRDLIQPRFGSNAYGSGWWDWPGSAEVRTNPDDPLATIRASHRILAHLFRAAEAFRIIPCMDHIGNHIHFSLRHDATGRNIMPLKTKEDADLGERMLTGLYTLFMEAPHLIQDFDPKNLGYNIDMDAGGFRRHALRQTGETWEFRRDYESGFPHTARDMALIMGGCAYGAFEIGDLKNHQRERKIDIKRVDYPIVRNRFGGQASAMQRLIESSEIGPDGHLKASPFAIERYIRPLNKLLGKKKLDVFTHRPKGYRKPRGLELQETWTALVETLRLDEENVLQAGHLHSEIGDLLDPLDVTGRRTVLNGKCRPIIHGLQKLQDSAGELQQSKALKFAVGPAAAAAIASGLSGDYYDGKAAQAGTIMATKQLIVQRTRDNAGRKDIAWMALCDLINPALLAELHAALSNDTQDRKNALIAPSYDALRKAGNLVKTMGPHFRQAVESQIETLRKEESPSNFLISQMHDVLDFIDRDLMDFKSYGDSLAWGMLNNYIWHKEQGLTERKTRQKTRLFFTGYLTIHFQVAASDPARSLDEVKTLMAQAREFMRESFVYKKPDPEKTDEKPDTEKRKETREWYARQKRLLKIMGPVIDKSFQEAADIIAKIKHEPAESPPVFIPGGP